MPEGATVYAIGDMHGQIDLVNALLQDIIDRFTTEHTDRRVIVGLGDYVDRGPDSAEVVEMLISVDHHPGLETHFLRGNHEQALLDFLDTPETGPSWRRFGGDATLESYGVELPDPGAEDWFAIRDRFADVLPAEHLEFLKRLPTSFALGGYFFAHAGALPGRPLDEQTDRDLIWIRERFLEDKRPFDRVVVHGHSPRPDVHSDYRRIGVDTGAYFTGLLTAVRLEGAGRSLLQAQRNDEGQIGVSETPLK